MEACGISHETRHDQNNLVAPTGFEPVFQSRSSFRYRIRYVVHGGARTWSDAPATQAEAALVVPMRHDHDEGSSRARFIRDHPTIRDGVLDTRAFPGQPVRRPVSVQSTAAAGRRSEK